jgi:surfeit locus 1 family protein
VRRGLFLVLCLTLAAGFAALGVWQVERLQWKEALVARVEARLTAPPVAPPPAEDWSPEAVYTRVAVSGVFEHDRETLVQAVTEQGPGWWVITPLRTGAGVILINRGFVPDDRRRQDSRPGGQAPGPVSLTGLLRESEPRGGFLRSNAPEAGRWYSRDVEAIARARGLTEPVAPYFIDADATPNPGGFPIGGLTVVKFPNSHLIYALTWFGLFGLSLAGAWLVFRQGRRK